MAYLPVFIILLLISCCKSDDQLTQEKQLSPGETLISKGGIFVLGFFSPTSSNRSLYLGIWYHSIPERTVVWIANRDNPIITPSSTKLVITNSSDLVLSDSQGRTLWATMNNITAGGVGASAVLLNTGNLVLQLPNGTNIWQSFDHPTDTILPGMRFLLSYKARVVGRLVAWKGPNEPSTGDFSYSLDPSSNLQVFIWHGTRPYYRTGVWNGVSVSGGIYTGSIMYVTVAYMRDEFYFMYTVSAGSPSTIIKLDYTGKMRSLSWSNQSSSWTVFSERPPAASCELYASCGPFGYCDFTAAVPMCQCLDGFEPDFPRGCRRTEALKCGKENHFVPMAGMKVPDKFLHVKNRSFDQCAAECSRDCSCTGYAYANLSSSGAMADPSRCLVWTGELIDASKIGNAGETLYLRLADSPGKWPKKATQKRLMLGYLSASNELGGDNVEFPFVSFEDIVVATDNFSDSNQLGRGGFGKVYKGTLESGKEVAVKRLSKGSEQGIEEFRNEVILIAKLQHRNLVRLLGCCIHEDEKLLIYEYLPNKSLDAFLFGATRKSELNWPTRFKIIKGVARGLLYLHQDSRLTIIHRDLKASNILLDIEMTPKISDFGMARIFGGNQQLANTTRVVGTYGYMSPEYVMGGAFSVKSDTYSFGVLLLEIVSGLKISSPQLIMNFPSLTAYAWGLWKDGKAIELVDSSVAESCPLHEVLQCIHVGLVCSRLSK